MPQVGSQVRSQELLPALFVFALAGQPLPEEPPGFIGLGGLDPYIATTMRCARDQVAIFNEWISGLPLASEFETGGHPLRLLP